MPAVDQQDNTLVAVLREQLKVKDAQLTTSHTQSDIERQYFQQQLAQKEQQLAEKEKQLELLLKKLSGEGQI